MLQANNYVKYRFRSRFSVLFGFDAWPKYLKQGLPRVAKRKLRMLSKLNVKNYQKHLSVCINVIVSKVIKLKTNFGVNSSILSELEYESHIFNICHHSTVKTQSTQTNNNKKDNHLQAHTLPQT